MKRTIPILLAAVAIVVAVIACKDNFSEQDFLNYQNQHKKINDSTMVAKNAAALNDAGQLQSFTVQILEDKNPVKDVAVVVSNPPSGSKTVTLTATTDANGMAVFNNVVVGANTFVISKTGYSSATFIADFGKPTSGVHYIIDTNGYVVPVKQSASVQIPIFAKAGTAGETATIKGVVTIENDLTNLTPEIPQNITISANMIGITVNTGGGAGNLSSGGVTISTYFFNDGNVGVANVDNSTGAFNMTVPASSDGRQISLVVPNIDGNLKLAVNNINNTKNWSVQTVPASWGPAYVVNGTTTYDPIPSVPGAMATFPAPPAPGSGLAFQFTPIARPLDVANTNLNSANTNLSNAFSSVNNLTSYKLSDRGAGYTASPTIAITGGSGTGATMVASLRGVIASFNVNNAGTGYNGNVTITPQWIDANNVRHDLANTSFSVTATAAGNLPSTIAIPSLVVGYDPSNPFRTPSGQTVSGFAVKVGDGLGNASVSLTLANAEIDVLTVTNGGSGYSTAPSIAFSGGGSPSRQASLAILDFPVQWNVTISNNGSGYHVAPIRFSFQESTLANGLNFGSDVLDQFNNSYTVNTVNGPTTVLSINGNGGIDWFDKTKTYHTSDFSATIPQVILTPSVSVPAQATLSINTDGTIGGINPNQPVVRGQGYDVPFDATILSLAGTTKVGGSGANLKITGFTRNTDSNGDYKWGGGGLLTSGGSGYQINANQIGQYYFGNASGVAAVAFTSPGTITVKTGDVVNYNINYGTGQRKVNVN